LSGYRNGTSGPVAASNGSERRIVAGVERSECECCQLRSAVDKEITTAIEREASPSLQLMN